MVSANLLCFVATIAIIGLCSTDAAHVSRRLLDDGCAQPYGQCGGQTCTNGSVACSDTAYTCCPTKYNCQRQSQWYWGCAPTLQSVSSPSPAPTQAASQSPTSSSPPPSSPSSTPASSSSPEAESPEEAPSEETPAIGCNTYEYFFASFLDSSGVDAPDGNYKETCSNITYNCSTDTVAATCGNEASGSNFSFLIAASECSETIMNINGILKCQPQPAPSPSSSSTCGITFLYESELDQSGLYAPDGNYKETCKNIAYDCNEDMVYAACSNDAGTAYLISSFNPASECASYGNLANIGGALECQLSPSLESSEEAPPEEYPSEEAPSEEAPAEGCVTFKFFFSSYLDGSGMDAPDGSYKQDCSNISYNCNTDTISANCGRGITSFTNALDCLDVLNVGGALRCLPASPPAPSSSSACAVRYHFESKIDQSGLGAPDGSYKETCKSIDYNCNTDTVDAQCTNQDSTEYVPVTYSPAGNCASQGNLENVGGNLECQLFPYL